MSEPRKRNAPANALTNPLASLFRRARASSDRVSGECGSGAASSVADGVAGGETRSDAGRDVWEKWYLGSLYAFYLLLGVATVVSQLSDGMSPPERFVALGFSALLAGWHYLTLHRRADAVYRNAPAILLYFAVVLALLAVLINLDSFYSFMAFILFWQNFSLWGLRYAIPGALVGSVYMVWTNSDYTNPLVTFGSPEALGYLLIPIPISIALGLFITSIIHQSRERRGLIEELRETREELAAEERRAGVLEERGRLAREIHDTLAQGFISIVTHLEAAEEDESPGETRRHLDQAKLTARENLVEARRLVAALRPEILEGSSLPKALARLAERWSEASGVEIRLEVTGEESRLPQELQVTLLRAAQEALSNVKRHAGANRVNLTLSYMEDLALLDAQDDGRGFDPDSECSDAEGGFGLRAMRERVESLGGRLLVESAPGEGTTLAVQLPVGVLSETGAVEESTVETG